MSALPTSAPSFELGMAAVRERRYGAAFPALETAAEEGVAEAYFELGMLYAFGRGVPASNDHAAAFFSRGAEAGSPNAQYAYAVALFPHDRINAEKWLLRASEANHPPAMTRLADLIRDRDPATARALLARAAQAGHAEAMRGFGHALATGLGGPLDPIEGLAWLYASACVEGRPHATRDALTLARVMRADAIEAAQRRGRVLAKQHRKR
ncbi:MAG: sel1 repeat family protein [Hyphomonadaceae bacterium]|nr:sel1 repeat family protein [Hyphomonadaceae bacterium]